MFVSRLYKGLAECGVRFVSERARSVLWQLRRSFVIYHPLGSDRVDIRTCVRADPRFVPEYHSDELVI
jgi:hypothetical protein